MPETVFGLLVLLLIAAMIGAFWWAIEFLFETEDHDEWQ